MPRPDARGQLDAGLFFISFQRDPHKQFVPLQQRLAANDRLNEYIRHTASALFACPPGARKGGFVGELLLARPDLGHRRQRIPGFQTRPRAWIHPERQRPDPKPRPLPFRLHPVHAVV